MGIGRKRRGGRCVAARVWGPPAKAASANSQLTRTHSAILWPAAQGASLSKWRFSAGFSLRHAWRASGQLARQPRGRRLGAVGMDRMKKLAHAGS